MPKRDELFIERRPQGDYAVRRPNSQRASDVLQTQGEAIDRDGLLYCSFHDPAGTKKHAESLAEERAKALWAAATVRADADGVKVFLIREDVLAAVISLLAHLPYKDVNRLMRALAALPEAPVLGRERILE